MRSSECGMLNGLRVAGLGLRVSDFEFQVSSIKFQTHFSCIVQTPSHESSGGLNIPLDTTQVIESCELWHLGFPIPGQRRGSGAAICRRLHPACSAFSIEVGLRQIPPLHGYAFDKTRLKVLARRS